ncbi:MAG: molecular chaperone HtpG [Spirochaetota bacterium]|nr:molecular chaperone HtpG [Spirochaetota bacterium]
MTATKRKFKAETKKILHLVTHSLYSNKDIFLRELISNASDAIDKIRFESLTNKEILENNSDWKIKIIADKEKNTLTISDNGIGMNKDEVIENLGTIAKSGTEAFVKLAQQGELKNHPELIGQFGVGFYSALMVADKVTVITRRAGDKNDAVKWECTGEEEFTIDTVAKEARGTDIILHLTEDYKDYLEDYKIRDIVKRYSDYIEFPVTMDVEREEVPKSDKLVDMDGKPIEGAKPVKVIVEETLNTKKAIWLRDKNEVTEDEYKEFFKHISNDFTEPLVHVHYKIEGATEFTALIYIPSMRPFNLFTKDQPKNNVHLYVKRVFILKNSEAILPEYFRFISGVVDSSDLPLNISREVLQEHHILRAIRKNLVKKVISTLKDLKDKEYDKYKGFYDQFSSMLKEGIISDYENRESLLDLLLYRSNKTTGNEYISLDRYIQNMPSEQKDIYYITGDSYKDVENASHLEVFKEKGYAVLFFVEPIDEIMATNAIVYKDKHFKSVMKGDLDIGEKDKAKIKEKSEEYKSLTDFMQKSLDEHVKEVRLTERLVNSASCIVGDEFDMSIHLEKVMKAYNKDLPPTKRILEINPKHPVVEKIKTLFEKDNNDPKVRDYAELLYDQALIAEGSKVSDPNKFNQRLYDLILTN